MLAQKLHFKTWLVSDAARCPFSSSGTLSVANLAPLYGLRLSVPKLNCLIYKKVDDPSKNRINCEIK